MGSDIFCVIPSRADGEGPYNHSVANLSGHNETRTSGAPICASLVIARAGSAFSAKRTIVCVAQIVRHTLADAQLWGPSQSTRLGMTEEMKFRCCTFQAALVRRHVRRFSKKDFRRRGAFRNSASQRFLRLKNTQPPQLHCT